MYALTLTKGGTSRRPLILIKSSYAYSNCIIESVVFVVTNINAASLH